MRRTTVVSALLISTLFVSSAWAAPLDTRKNDKPVIKVTRTVLPQEATKKKMPLLLLAIIAAAADSADGFRSRIGKQAE